MVDPSHSLSEWHGTPGHGFHGRDGGASLESDGRPLNPGLAGTHPSRWAFATLVRPSRSAASARRRSTVGSPVLTRGGSSGEGNCEDRACTTTWPVRDGPVATASSSASASCPLGVDLSVTQAPVIPIRPFKVRRRHRGAVRPSQASRPPRHGTGKTRRSPNRTFASAVSPGRNNSSTGHSPRVSSMPGPA